MSARRVWRLLPLLILLLAVILRIADPQSVERLRLTVFDEYQKLAPRPYVEAPVRIIDIDERSIEKLGQWPWPRTRIAALISRLGEMGAATIAFDVLFAEPDSTSPNNILPVWGALPDADRTAQLARIVGELPDHDHVLADAISTVPTVLGMMFTNEGVARRPPRVLWGMAVAGDDPRPFLTAFDDSIPNLPELEATASGQGSFNSAADSDGIIRHLPILLRLRQGDTVTTEVYPAIAAEALRVAQGASAYVLRTSGAAGNTAFGENTGITHIRIGRIDVPTDRHGHIWLRDTGHVPQRFVPAWQVFEDDFDASRVSGQILLIGTSAAGLRDIRTTPLSANMAGVEIHAQAIEQMLLGVSLERPDWMTGAEIAWLLVFGLVIAVLIPRWGASWCALIAAGGIVLAIAASWAAFIELDWLVDPIFPSLVALLLYLTQSFLLFLQTESERRHVRGAFSRYLSPALVEKLAHDPSLLKLGGEIREMTILFSDIRGFTAISETMEADELTGFMNAYLTPMTEIILARGGTIDKYMGDAIMAFWNAPLDDPDHAGHAAGAALDMLARLETLNAEWLAAAQAQNRPAISIGIGLNTGPCCVGNMGSMQRFDYSVLGDAANIASRLEGQSKTYGVPIVAGEPTMLQAPDLAWLELDLVRVVGKDRPIRIYALLGDTTVARSAWFATTRDTQAEFMRAYRAADWTAAGSILPRLRSAAGGRLDDLAALYASRIETLREAGTVTGWDGAFTATEK